MIQKSSNIPKKEEIDGNVIGIQFNSPDSAFDSPGTPKTPKMIELTSEDQSFSNSILCLEEENKSLKIDNEDLHNYVSKITRTSSFVLEECEELEKKLNEEIEKNEIKDETIEKLIEEKRILSEKYDNLKIALKNETNEKLTQEYEIETLKK